MNETIQNVEAELVYSIDTGEPLYYEIFGTTEVGDRNAKTDPRAVAIHDGRDASAASSWSSTVSSWSLTPAPSLTFLT